MYLCQIEQLARQRTDELRRTMGACRARVAGPRRARDGRPGAGNTIRNRAGWTLVAIGLRLAESRGE